MRFSFLCGAGVWLPSHLSLLERLRLLRLRLRALFLKCKAVPSAQSPWIRALICPECAALRGAEIKGLNSMSTVCPYCGSASSPRKSSVRLCGRLSFTGRRFCAEEYADVQNPAARIPILGIVEEEEKEAAFGATRNERRADSETAAPLSETTENERRADAEEEDDG